MAIQSIILCGGPGARLWPESTQVQPKPFIDLIGDRSLFQRTVARMALVSEDRQPLVVTGLAYVDQVRRQLRALGGGATIMAEPEGRDSGPALLAAALWVARQDPAAVVVAVASDHHIPDDDAFAAAVRAAHGAAAAGEIVTFGVRPAFAATGYGYIRSGEAFTDHPDVFRVGRFVEKPNAARAQALMADGALWNSGNFMFRAGALVDEARTHAPDLLAAVEAALDGAGRRDDVLELGEAFRRAPKRSIDVAVMEKTTRAAVLPIDYVWSDLGSWDSVWNASARDDVGNATIGAVVLQDSEACLVRAAPGTRVVGIGLRNLAVVVRGGDVLVSDMAAASTLKPALAALDALVPGRPVARVSGPALGPSAVRLRAWLWNQALPLWWCFGADHERGGFHESLRQDLTPVLGRRRARVQARQTYVYATMGGLGWPGPWRAAVGHGLAGLDARFRRPDGLYRGVVESDGAPADETAVLYDQAFVLLALAGAAEAQADQAAALEARARDLVGLVRGVLGHPDGGFRADDASQTFLANPIMHLFEGALAWLEAAGGAFWEAWAGELAGLFLDHLFDADGGRLFEVFDAQWRPQPGGAAGRLEPGHHFEWAWLIERWARRAKDPRAHGVALALHASGERGVDAVSGLALDELNGDFSVAKATSRLWPQTERLKSALLLAEVEAAGRPAYLASAEDALAAIESYLDTQVAGLWRDDPDRRGPKADDPALASSFYHIMGAILALEAHAAGASD